ncbi:F-box protein SKIP14 [Nicotiana tabacum]|uniref:F-box protein SKIP14 n=1 Tax=Nicotiana tabacum TaxID=4097 RepID=A0A1S4DN18_TOBAC|nr:PREDICTED: F-box protein SKIP14-like [Nicotiana tabacum]
MALNQHERFLAGLEFDRCNRYFDRECPNEKLDCSGDFWGLNCKVENFHDHNKTGKTKMVSDDISDFWGLKNCEKGSFRDPEDEETKMVSDDDIVDLLPQDPFGMGISTKVTAITGWLEDFDKDFGLKNLGFHADEIEVDAQMFAELNIVLNGAMRIHQDVGVQNIGENSYASEIDIGEGLCDSFGCMDVEMEEIINSSYWVFRDAAQKDQSGMNDHRNGDGGTPSDALFLALSYLCLRDLLSVERVCKPLRDVVRGDPLLWRNIHVDHPLSCKITDEILTKLTERAQGHLHSLSLVHCSKITDSGLNCVLERNPSLKKLSVPGCGRLTADGVLGNLKVFKPAGKPSLKYLGIDGLFGMTNQHFEEFKVLLDVDSSKLPTNRKPRFFQGGQLSVLSDDDQAIDIEICPKCQQLRLVYDCPSESCQKKQSTTQLCRACTICIKRCINCGRCLNNCEYEELFSFDLVCLDCCRQLLDHQESLERMTVPLENPILHKQASCHFFLCG